MTNNVQYTCYLSTQWGALCKIGVMFIGDVLYDIPFMIIIIWMKKSFYVMIKPVPAFRRIWTQLQQDNYRKQCGNRRNYTWRAIIQSFYFILKRYIYIYFHSCLFFNPFPHTTNLQQIILKTLIRGYIALHM